MIPLQGSNQSVLKKGHYLGILNASSSAQHHKQLLERKAAISSATRKAYMYQTLRKSKKSTQTKMSEQKYASVDFKFIVQPTHTRAITTYGSTPHDIKSNRGTRKLFDSKRTAVNDSTPQIDQSNYFKVMNYNCSPEHANMSIINLAKNYNNGHHLKAGGHPEKELFYEVWTKSGSSRPVRHHSHSVTVNFEKVTDAVANKLARKSKRMQRLGEQNRKRKNSVNNNIGYYSVLKYNPKRVLYKKLKNEKYELQGKRQATFARKLTRAFKDLVSLLNNLRDKNIAMTFLRGVKIALQNKRHYAKHNVNGKSSKYQNINSQHRKNRHFKVRAKIKIHNQRTKNGYENLKRHKDRNFNYSDSPNGWKQNRFNMSFDNRYDLTRYIIAENILRSGWPFLPQQRNRTNFYKVIDMIRDKVVLKDKQASNSTYDKNNITLALSTTMKTSHVIMRTIDIINSTRSQNNSLYQKNETASGIDKKLPSVLYPSYQVDSTILEKTPYLPPSSAEHALSQKISLTKLEESSAFRTCIPRSSTINTSKIVESVESLGLKNSNSTLNSTWQRLENQPTDISHQSTYLTKVSGFTTILTSSYVKVNRSSYLQFSSYISTEVKNAILTCHVSQRDHITTAKSLISVLKDERTASPEEKLMSDLIEAYDILLEEKNLLSYHFAATEISKKPQEAVLNTSLSANSNFLPSARYVKAPVDYDILSTLSSSFSSSMTNVNNLPLIDEEAASPESETQIHNRSELGDRLDQLND